MITTFKGQTFADVYQELLTELYSDPDCVSNPRGMACKEMLNVSLHIEDPEFPLYENERRSSQLRYIAGELLWYFAGRNDIDFISKYSKFWAHLDNGDGTVNSAYGNLIFREKNEHGVSQWQWAYDSLVADKDTRQAVLHYNKPSHQFKGNKDFVCTMYSNFHIRNNKLYLKTAMRSNDAILGTPTDIAFFCFLQQQMHRLLLPHYPKLELGSYTHTVDSMHIYERHFDLVKDMLANEFQAFSFPKIDHNLVDYKGIPSNALINTVYSIVNDSILNPSTKIMTWIYDNAK